MKKILSAILAILMIGTIAIPAFAAEETPQTKTVDNTFDNYTPAPGQKAPENWYDPYCYESDGRINKYCLNRADYGARYCPFFKKIFAVGYVAPRINENNKLERYQPYLTVLTNFPVFDRSLGEVKYLDKETTHYCPYCGHCLSIPYENEEQHRRDLEELEHPNVGRVVYGFQCETCDVFVASYAFAKIGVWDTDIFKFYDRYSNVCDKCSCENINLNNYHFYRFLTEEQRTSDYSFLFKETEMDFGDGKDGRVEDLKKNGDGVYVEWESEDNPHYEPKLTFWQKIVRFFTNIGLWFANLFK